jgi:hypothetical protein
LAEAAGAAISLAATSDDPKDQADAEKGHAERTAGAAQAAEAFPANEEKTSAEMKGIDQTSQMAQQLPQMASSIGGALAGAIGGLMQPLTQIPQQLAQTGQQLLQQGMGAMQDKGGDELTPEDLDATALGDDFGGGAPGSGEGEGGGGSGGGGAGMGGTTPMSMLGPPAAPSATTTPTSARTMPPVSAPPAPAATAPMGGMGGMPMMPHGGMGGGGAESKDDKADTKRVSVPSVKNGAPVQGRFTTPPPAPTVTKRIDGKAVASKRIIVPSDRTDDKRDTGNDAER